MERYVLVYQLSDGYSYSFDETVPILYESAEQLLIDVEEFCKVGKEFEICGHLFDPNDFSSDGKFYAPDIYTLDEWFDNYYEGE